VNRSARVLVHALAQPPTLGLGRLICVDGPSGSGKSTLARELAAASGAPVVHTDDLCRGWDGIPGLPEVLDDLLRPLVAGNHGRAPRYDWISENLVTDIEVISAPLLVVEGVGAGCRLLADLRTTGVWVDAAPEVRRQRALERDGDAFDDYWAAWAAAEAAYFANDDVAARADLSLMT
jgi:uridine kinase